MCSIFKKTSKMFLPVGRGLPQTTGLPGNCTPCLCLRYRPAPSGPERAASGTPPSLSDTGLCTERQHRHYKEEDNYQWAFQKREHLSDALLFAHLQMSQGDSISGMCKAFLTSPLLSQLIWAELLIQGGTSRIDAE